MIPREDLGAGLRVVGGHLTCFHSKQFFEYLVWGTAVCQFILRVISVENLHEKTHDNCRARLRCKL